MTKSLHCLGDDVCHRLLKLTSLWGGRGWALNRWGGRGWRRGQLTRWGGRGWRLGQLIRWGGRSAVIFPIPGEAVA